MNKLVKTCSSKELYSEFCQALNGILQLTDRELELLAALIDLQKRKIFQNHDSLINADNRKLLHKTTGITMDNLSRYFTKFKERGILVKGNIDNQWLVNQALIPEVIRNTVQITIIVKTNDNYDSSK